MAGMLSDIDIPLRVGCEHFRPSELGVGASAIRISFGSVSCQRADDPVRCDLPDIVTDVFTDVEIAGLVKDDAARITKSRRGEGPIGMLSDNLVYNSQKWTK
jgi:hypothetical protein